MPQQLAVVTWLMSFGVFFVAAAAAAYEEHNHSSNRFRSPHDRHTNMHHYLRHAAVVPRFCSARAGVVPQVWKCVTGLQLHQNAQTMQLVLEPPLQIIWTHPCSFAVLWCLQGCQGGGCWLQIKPCPTTMHPAAAYTSSGFPQSPKPRTRASTFPAPPPAVCWQGRMSFNATKVSAAQRATPVDQQPAAATALQGTPSTLDPSSSHGARTLHRV